MRPALALGAGALLASAYQPVDLFAMSVPAVAVFTVVAWSSTRPGGGAYDDVSPLQVRRGATLATVRRAMPGA